MIKCLLEEPVMPLLEIDGGGDGDGGCVWEMGNQNGNGGGEGIMSVSSSSITVESEFSDPELAWIDEALKIPLNYSNGDTTNALQQEIVRLQSELESSNARFESSNARMEASNAQLKLEMRGVFNILKNIMGNVPSEFAHMINSEVPKASNGQSSSVGHSFSASEDHPNT
ncbi:uncharacterized protein G2W53_015064 [Senna tora]|uniref:Uncharacterized protein n=1 Tax=Senna tora TaxID=362788 RepID=A0A834WUJ8_9FABA|nr:uncharacterized protein G2W53_015064 [Senna tora]